MEMQPLKRASTPLDKVAKEPARKVANGRVVKRGGVAFILKHKPYNPPAACVQASTDGTAWASLQKRYLTQRY